MTSEAFWITSPLCFFFLLYFLVKERIVECCKYFSFSELVKGGPRFVGFIGTGKATCGIVQVPDSRSSRASRGLSAAALFRVILVLVE